MWYRTLGTVLFVLFTAPSVQAGVLEVTRPGTGNTTVTRAGNDYATQVLSDPWDMGDAADIPQAPSSDLANAAVTAGVFEADTIGNDPNFFILWPGYVSAVPMAKGAVFPIDTGRFRYLTMKIRMTAASGPPLAHSQPVIAYFLLNSRFQPGSFGHTSAASVTPGQWQIVQFDMLDAPSAFGWTDTPVIRGLRIDPTNKSGVHFEIDWIRLSAPMSDSSQGFLVTWTDSGSGPYTVAAVDADGASLVLGNGISAQQHLADLSTLPPGSYSIEVSRAGAIASSPGRVRINHPPVVTPLQPDVRGDTARSFALKVVGNPWGPMDNADIAATTGLTNLSFSNPAGSFTARPTSNDPSVSFAMFGHSVDTNFYRSLCFTLQVHGPVDVGTGSVARVFWGTGASLVTSDDIVLHKGLNEYCFADMDKLPTGSGGVPGKWDPPITTIRLDPHEFPVSTVCINAPSPAHCHDVGIDSLVLSPLDSADPAYDFTWKVTDPDRSDVTVTVYLDTDHEINGNEMLVAVSSSSNGNGAGGTTFVATTGNVMPGVYDVLFVSDDGINKVSHYAAGQLNVMTTVADSIFKNGFE